MELHQARSLAIDLMRQHGLDDWQFQFNKRKRHLGLCNQTKKTIYLSIPYVSLNEESEIKQTILHEIAHALVGCRHNHDMVWWLKAKEIGVINPGRCHDGVVLLPPRKYRAVCLDCKQEVGGFDRRPKRSYIHAACKYKGNKGKLIIEER